MSQDFEEAQEWLARVAKEAAIPQTQQLATMTLASWNGLLASWANRGVKTRRSLYDLLSGLLQVAHNYTWNTTCTKVRSGSQVFVFPIFAEACDYRGRARPPGAVVAGVRIQSHRRVQKAKWGNDVLKT